MSSATRFSPAALRALRIAAGLSREHLAAQIDRSVYTIVDYERGRATPSADTLGTLADALGCSVGDFYTQEDR